MRGRELLVRRAAARAAGLVLPTLCLLGLPVAARAAGVGGEGGLQRFLFEIANLVLLLVVLVVASRKAVGSYLSERRRGIEEDMQSAAKLLSDAEARLAEWSERAERLDQEVAGIKASARRAAEGERDALIAEARETAGRIRRSAAGAVDRELRLARAALQNEAAELAVALASERLQDSIDAEDRTRLFDDFVQKVDSGGTH